MTTPLEYTNERRQRVTALKRAFDLWHTASTHRPATEQSITLLEQVNPAMFEWFTNPAEPPAQVILRCINQEFESMGREGVVTAFSVLPGKFQVVTVTYVMPPLKAGGKFQHRHAVYVDGVCQSSGISGHTDNGANV